MSQRLFPGMSRDPYFSVGDTVIKPVGYPFPGTVLAVFATSTGAIRIVVESRTAPGLLHIFSPEQVELAPERP
jgi:hypothetical protein